VSSNRYTRKQGQYLTFIYYYSKINGRAPSEADIKAYFRVTATSVHAMILPLANHGLLERVPSQARSLRLLISRDLLPDLDEPNTAGVSQQPCDNDNWICRLSQSRRRAREVEPGGEAP
jgi:hypothetical protein